jgi:chemotaxis protein methyltransferase CheR
MKGEEFEFLASLLKRGSGLSLTPERTELITGRLKAVAERHGFATIPALVQALRNGNESLVRSVIEAATTRDTSFFRDSIAFDALRDQILPALLRARSPSRRLRIWCAAAATGQEPYSLTMIIDEMPQFAGWEIQILATDVSADAIERAGTGLFSEAEVQRGLPMRMLSKYFRKETAGWRIADELRDRVQLRVFNLMDCFAGLGMFDVIFCRNVLMYLDATAKSDILERLGGSLEADGYLVIGAAETTLGACNSFTVLPNLGGITMKARRAQDLRSAGMRK